MISDITPEHDTKVKTGTAFRKSRGPSIQAQKVLIFLHSDTAEYLYQNVQPHKDKYGLDTAMISAAWMERPLYKIPGNAEHVNLLLPISADKHLLVPDSPEIDILIGTDCGFRGTEFAGLRLLRTMTSTGTGAIIQRFASYRPYRQQNAVIQLVNFWPDLTLCEVYQPRAPVKRG